VLPLAATAALKRHGVGVVAGHTAAARPARYGGAHRRLRGSGGWCESKHQLDGSRSHHLGGGLLRRSFLAAVLPVVRLQLVSVLEPLVAHGAAVSVPAKGNMR